MSAYEPVIGIECHVELKTATKMFCGCPNEFGGEPNTSLCPVCLALPGALPVPNRAAIELILRTGVALGAEIPEFSKFDRKNYFYPDMPKNYQISQYDMPLAKGGAVRYWLEDGTVKSCALVRIHLEEDTGKSTHAGSGDGRIAGSSYSLVDFNRAGVPLMECVSEPELHGAQEAVAYLESLRRTLMELGVSDVKMEEGSLRCDANVSVRLVGSTKLGTKTEIKNMNSFRSVHRAIESEIERQITLLESGGRVVQETRGWDEAHGVTHSMRSKEEAHDYRYFPDPDLVPLEISSVDVERLRCELRDPLPWERFARYTQEYAFGAKQATQLIDSPALERVFLETVRAGGSAKLALNFVLGDIARVANEHGVNAAQLGGTPEQLAELIGLVEANTITSKAAKRIVDVFWAPGPSDVSGTSIARYVEREGLAQTSDPAAIEKFVEEVFAANPSVVEACRSGKPSGAGFLVGQVMKASRGKADPQLTAQLVKKRLG